MKKKLFTIMLTIFVGIGLLFGPKNQSVYNKTLAEKLIREDAAVPKISRQGGWVVPGLKLAKNSSRLEKMVSSEGVTFQRREMVLPKNTYDNLESYFKISDGSILINLQHCAVDSIYSYVLNNRVFAYEIGMVPVFFGANRNVTHAGAVVILHYYDANGDGLFEDRYTNLKSSYVPDWVKQLSK